MIESEPPWFKAVMTKIRKGQYKKPSPKRTCRAPWHPKDVTRRWRGKKAQPSCPRCKRYKARGFKGSW